MVRAASEMGQLFGSVTSRDIADAVTEAGFTIDRNQVIMDRSIKALGLTEARVRLHPEVVVTITVNIARSLAEAETQLETGIAVTGEITDDEPEVVEVETAEVETVEVEVAEAKDGEDGDSAKLVHARNHLVETDQMETGALSPVFFTYPRTSPKLT
jgi:large subunit ribosomal protein L9